MELSPPWGVEAKLRTAVVPNPAMWVGSKVGVSCPLRCFQDGLGWSDPTKPQGITLLSEETMSLVRMAAYAALVGMTVAFMRRLLIEDASFVGKVPATEMSLLEAMLLA